jgi:hypothetical protein
MGFPHRITSIKGLSERNRLPRLGKIRLGLKVKNKNAKPDCHCGPEEGCFKCSYPVETPYFVVPPEVAKVCGEKPVELKVKVPVNNLEVVFPRAYKYYGSSRGLKCTGDLEIAFRLDEKTSAMKEVRCPCELRDKQCNPSGVLNVLLPEVSMKGVYQITTGSWNSMVDVASGLHYVECILGRFAMVPLILRRIPTITHHKGQKQTHYTLQVLLDTESPDFPRKLPPAPRDEKLSLPPADDIRPDLEGPVTTEEEIRDGKVLGPGGLSGASRSDERESIDSVVTAIKNILVKTERDSRGAPSKKYTIVTESAGIYVTYDEAIKNDALAAMKRTAFVEIEFLADPKDGNLIKSLRAVPDERAQ